MLRTDVRHGEQGGGTGPADDEPNFRALAVRIFLVNLLVLAGAYTLYWYWTANAVELEIMQWIERQRAAGQTLAFADYSRGGFPLAVTLSFRDVRYAPSASADGWSYHVDGVTLRHRIDNSSSLGITLSGSQQLAFGTGESRTVYGGGFEEAAATLRSGGWLPNGEAMVREMALVEDASQRGLAVGTLTLTAKGNPAQPPAPDKPGYSVALGAARLALPGIGPLPFGPEIAKLTIDAEVMGALRPLPMPDLVSVWREAGGAIELTHVAATYGPVSVEGTGTLTLNPENQPEAAFSFEVEGFPQLVDQLVKTGALNGTTAAGLKGLVMVTARTGADGKSRVRVPLTLQDRVLSVGPVPLATLPIIHWPGSRVTSTDTSIDG